MTNEMTFSTNSLFENVTFNQDADFWTFSFAGNIYVCASGFWRLLINNKIAFVSLDNRHQFGLSKPLDLVEEVNKVLTGKRLMKIEILKDTCDLRLDFTDELKLDIYISSAGYESYDFSIKGKRYIGLGSGDLSIMDIL